MKKKILMLLAVLILTTTTVIPSIVNGDDTTDQQLQKENEFIDYRGGLITFQPQFSVEGGDMITRKKAESSMLKSINTSLDEGYYLCRNTTDDIDWQTDEINGCDGYELSKEDLYFQNGGFDWYIWYEQVYGYSRFAPIKTMIAKFPINNSSSQTSYALFSYQGYWQKSAVEDNFYVMQLIDSTDPYPDSNRQVMFFDPDIDYPLFFTNNVSSRYSLGSTSFYFNEDSVVRLKQKDHYTEPYIDYKRSLQKGNLLDFSDMTVEEVKEEYEQLSI